MLPTQACASHTGPQGCFVHNWNVCVEHCLQLHPICTMHTRPIHEVPAYTHQPNSHFPHGWCTIMCPPYTFPFKILSIFPHPGTAMHVPNPVTLPHLDTVAHLVTHSLERLGFSTGPRRPSFGRLAHSLEAHHHSPATLAMFCLHACAHLHLWCRWDNNILRELPTECSFDGQNMLSLLS